MTIAKIEMLYDKYAPAFYGELKRRQFDSKQSEKILTRVFLKLYALPENFNPEKEVMFIRAYGVLQHEIAAALAAKSPVL